MKIRTLFLAALGSLVIVSAPSLALAQTPDDATPAVQAPATHDHDHAATDPSAARSCCGGMNHSQAQNDTTAATPPAAHEHGAPADNAGKAPEKGCCAGMMTSRDTGAADASKPSEQACCCMNMSRSEDSSAR